MENRCEEMGHAEVTICWQEGGARQEDPRMGCIEQIRVRSKASGRGEGEVAWRRLELLGQNRPFHSAFQSSKLPCGYEDHDGNATKKAV